MDYNEFSEKIKAKYPQYKDIDNKELAQKMIEKYPQYKEQINFDISENAEPQGIDLTPSGLINQGANAIVSAVETPIRMIKDKQSPKEAYLSAYKSGKQARKQLEQSKPILSGLSNVGTDLLGYGLLPVKGGFLGQATIQGGLPFALESLKQGENPLAGLGIGTGIGATIQSIPYVGKVLRGANRLGLKGVGKLAQLKPETVNKAIQPDSKALDLTKEQADKLAQDTTERLQTDYQNLRNKLGNKVDEEVQALNQLEEEIPINNLENDITDVFNAEQMGRVNPARELNGDTEAELYDLLSRIDEEGTGTLTPYELVGLRRIIGNKINWDNMDNYSKNQLLSKIYGKFNNRINELSPEIKEANKDYSNIRNLLDEKGRLRTILNPKADIETSTSKLKNYKSTNEDIYNLENRLVKEGAEPYLSNIDDVNAALDLLKNEKTGLGGLSEIAKTMLTRPILSGVRALNRTNLPQYYNNVVETLSPLAEKLLTPVAVKGIAPMLLQGGVSNVTDDYGYGY